MYSCEDLEVSVQICRIVHSKTNIEIRTVLKKLLCTNQEILSSYGFSIKRRVNPKEYPLILFV